MSAETGTEANDTGDAAILGRLEHGYRTKHPKAAIRAYRLDEVTIRICVIDPDFHGMSRADRDDLIWELLSSLPEETQADITMLLLLTPEEAKTSFVNMEFEDPSLTIH